MHGRLPINYAVFVFLILAYPTRAAAVRDAGRKAFPSLNDTRLPGPTQSDRWNENLIDRECASFDRRASRRRSAVETQQDCRCFTIRRGTNIGFLD
jgi:hypothetical protein